MKENTKNTLRKIGMKLLLLIAVLAVLDVLYFFTFYPKDLEEHCSLMELSQKPVPEGDDIVYLGESSNHAYSEADTDRRPISMMLDSLLLHTKLEIWGKLLVMQVYTMTFCATYPVKTRSRLRLSPSTCALFPANGYTPNWKSHYGKNS